MVSCAALNYLCWAFHLAALVHFCASPFKMAAVHCEAVVVLMAHPFLRINQ